MVAGFYGLLNFDLFVTRNSKVLGSNLGRIGLCHRGRAYTVILTIQRPGVGNAVYGTVHYGEPLR